MCALHPFPEDIGLPLHRARMDHLREQVGIEEARWQAVLVRDKAIQDRDLAIQREQTAAQERDLAIQREQAAIQREKACLEKLKKLGKDRQSVGH